MYENYTSLTYVLVPQHSVWLGFVGSM